jgi:hypothetical protein
LIAALALSGFALEVGATLLMGLAIVARDRDIALEGFYDGHPAVVLEVAGGILYFATPLAIGLFLRGERVLPEAWIIAGATSLGSLTGTWASATARAFYGGPVLALLAWAVAFPAGAAIATALVVFAARFRMAFVPPLVGAVAFMYVWAVLHPSSCIIEVGGQEMCDYPHPSFNSDVEIVTVAILVGAGAFFFGLGGMRILRRLGRRERPAATEGG